MAEIHVEKKRTNIWPWIIGLILAVLLVWGIAAMVNRNRNNGAARTSALFAIPQVEVVATAPLPLAA
jgi:hypothetical protein